MFVKNSSRDPLYRPLKHLSSRDVRPYKLIYRSVERDSTSDSRRLVCVHVGQGEAPVIAHRPTSGRKERIWSARRELLPRCQWWGVGCQKMDCPLPQDAGWGVTHGYRCASCWAGDTSSPAFVHSCTRPTGDPTRESACRAALSESDVLVPRSRHERLRPRGIRDSAGHT